MRGRAKNWIAHAWILPAWLALSCAAAAPVVAKQDLQLGMPMTDPAAITKVMSGNTLEGVYAETGETWAEYYCDSGKSLYDFRGGISLGKWWVQDAQVCFSYDWSAYQHVQCFEMFTKQDGATTFVALDNAGAPIMTFRSGPPQPGDPFHMEQRAARGCQPEPSV